MMQKRSIIYAIGCNLVSKDNDSDDQLKLEFQMKKILNEFEVYSSDSLCSKIYHSPAYPLGSGPDYLNAAVHMTSDLPAIELLGICREIEEKFHRERSYRWAPRSCDVDLIFVGQEILLSHKKWCEWANLSDAEYVSRQPDHIVIPHPRAHFRNFVLVPIGEIAPNHVHPVFNETVEKLRDKLPQEELSQIRVTESE